MKFHNLIAGVALLAIGAGFAFAQTSNRQETGGALWSIDGVLNIGAAGALKFNDVDKTAALAAAVATPVAGVAAGYKTARGETALDGTNPTPVTPGLATIVACSVSIKTTAAPGVGTSIVTYSTSTTTLNLYGWKVTATGDATLIASTGTETIGWVCVGT